MRRFQRTAELLLKHCADVQPDESVLIVVDDYARPIAMGQVVADIAKDIGANTVMMITSPQLIAGQEVLPPTGAAMQHADCIIAINEKQGIAHTNARKEASAKGARLYTFNLEHGEDHFDRAISLEDLELLRDRAIRLTEIFNQGDQVHITTCLGTDLRFSLAGRIGMAVQPFAKRFAAWPDFAKATISPVEGTGEGTLVVDAFIIGWNYLFREPLRYTIRQGRVVGVQGPHAEVQRVREILSRDEGASNCPCQFSMGVSHTVDAVRRGSRWESGKIGLAEIACGRNNDIGGTTFSKIHFDNLFTQTTVLLDGGLLMENGEWCWE